MDKSIIERLIEFNADRLPGMRALKYKKMRADAFSFFRGSCHLFYEGWPANSILNTAPLTWVCGDLHMENFGGYVGADHQVYFDINDFDEGALAPCTWDVTRFITSLILAGNLRRMSKENIQELCMRFLDEYFATLARGHIHDVEQENATGPVKKLLHETKTRKHAEFLDERSIKTPSGRKFKPETANFLPVKPEEREMVTSIIKKLEKSEKEADFYKVHDIAFRVAGTGSLGIRRYAALVEGKATPDKNFILDIKEARCSALSPYLPEPQPDWADQAERTVKIQKRMQGKPPSLLTSVVLDGSAFVIKEYQAQQDRISLAGWAEKFPQAMELISTLAEILAWDELRSAGSQGAASAEDLMKFGRQAVLKIVLLDFAGTHAKKAREDFEQFARAYDDGIFEDFVPKRILG